jgi:hypothetical protein
VSLKHASFVILHSHTLGSTVIPGPTNCKVAIDLRRRRPGRSGRIIALCNLDLSALDKGESAHVYVKRGPCSPTVSVPADISLDLKSDVNDKVGELTVRVTSSLASTSEAVKNATQTVQPLDPGRDVVNDPIQAITPLATAITDWASDWKPLLDRLAALVKVADAVAKARYILNCLSPMTTKKHLQTGSPLDHVNMGSGLSSV